MTGQVPSPQASRPSGHARDLQAQLYRDIGISAVAAALRFTTMPDPTAPSVAAGTGHRAVRPGSLAA